MTKRKKLYIELCVLAILGGSGMACFFLSGDFNLSNKDVHQEYYWTIPPMILEVLGIIFVVGLVVWRSRQHLKFPIQLERTPLLWLCALNGIVCALMGGIILYIFASLYWETWSTSGEGLQNDNKQPILALLGFEGLGLLLFATFCIVASGVYCRNFIDTWRTPKVEADSKNE